jgi:hypothetical protein
VAICRLAKTIPLKYVPLGLESNEVNPGKGIARREGVVDRHVSCMVNLTMLPPDIVATILDETLPPEVMPVLWEEQQKKIGA